MSNATQHPAHHVRSLTRASDSELQSLAALLIDCVEGGASVSFMHPLGLDKALVFWRGVAAAAERGERGQPYGAVSSTAVE